MTRENQSMILYAINMVHRVAIYRNEACFLEIPYQGEFKQLIEGNICHKFENWKVQSYVINPQDRRVRGDDAMPVITVVRHSIIGLRSARLSSALLGLVNSFLPHLSSPPYSNRLPFDVAKPGLPIVPP